MIEGVGDEFERHVVAWCIDHFVPLRHFRPGEIHLAFYERFCIDPVGEARALFEHIGSPFDDHAAATALRPSATTQRDSAILSGEDLVGRWRRDVTDDQLRRTMDLLRAFGLDRLYGPDTMPLVSAPDDVLLAR